MSLYEGLSLLLSTMATIVTVALGIRKLRKASPVDRAAPAPPVTPPPRPAVPGSAAPIQTYRAPPAYSAPPPYAAPPPQVARPPHAAPPPYGWPTPSYVVGRNPQTTAPRVAPPAVRSAGIILFIAAALQPLTIFADFVIAIASAVSTAPTGAEVSDGLVDLITCALVAVLCGGLGLLVIRGSRVGVWCLWLLTLIGLPFTGLMVLGGFALLLDPVEADVPAGLVLVFLVYLMLLSAALIASAVLTLNSKALQFFFAKTR